jgi:ribonuclease HI
MYCDDLCLFLKGNSLTELQVPLQNSIDSVSQWANQSGYEFSEEKTVAMVFTRKYKIGDIPELVLNGKNIEFVDNHTFLGAEFDKRLRWKNHISKIRSKASKSLNILKMLSNYNLGCDRTTLLRILNSYVLSILDFSSPIYATASKTLLKPLDSIFHNGIRLATGAFRTSPVESLCVDANCLPLSLRREKLISNFAIRIISQASHPLYEKLINDSLYSKYHDRTENFQPIYTRCRTLLQKNEITLKLDIKTDCSLPPWILQNFKIDLSLNKFKKNNTSNLMYKKLFLEIQDKYSTHQKIFTDGTLMDGKSGCAFIWNDLQQKFNLNSNATVFSAELFAMLKAIESTISTSQTHFIIFSDSLSSIQAITNIFSKNPLVQRILDTIGYSNNQYVFCWIPGHTGIVQNELVDLLAKQSIQDHDVQPHDFKPNKFDIKSKMKQIIYSKWSREWELVTNNKLKVIKPYIGPWKNMELLNRKQTVTITRLRIGHSLLTHKYLMERIPAPQCTCGHRLSIHHLFGDCVRASGLRRKWNLSIYSLSSNDVTVMRRILSFLAELHLLDKI